MVWRLTSFFLKGIFVQEGSGGTHFDQGQFEIKTFPIYAPSLCLRLVSTQKFWKIQSALNFHCNVCKRLHFWNGNEPENPFLPSKLAENKDILVKKFWTACKTQHWDAKNANITWKSSYDKCLRIGFLIILIKTLVFKILTQRAQKEPKKCFLAKNVFWHFFGQHFQKKKPSS